MQIRSIQVLRGVAASEVVLCHIHDWEAKHMGLYAVMPGIFEHGMAGVDLFFVISGFIMVFIEPAPINSRNSYLRFIINRVTRIYPPLWIILLALLPVLLLHPELFNNYYHNHVDIIKSFLLLPENYTPFLDVAWTLIHEVYFYLIVSFALIFSRRGRWIFGCIWFLTVLSVYLCFRKNEFHHIRVLQLIFSPFSLTFLLGYFIGLLFDRLRTAPSWLVFGLFGAGIAAAALSMAIPWPYPVGVYPDNNSLFRFAIYGLPAAILVAAAVAFESYLPKSILHIDFLGDMSYATYLIHLPVVTVFYIVLAKMGMHSPVLMILSAIACLFICLLLSGLFHIFVEMRVTRTSRNWLETLLVVRAWSTT